MATQPHSASVQAGYAAGHAQSPLPGNRCIEADARPRASAPPRDASLRVALDRGRPVPQPSMIAFAVRETPRIRGRLYAFVRSISRRSRARRRLRRLCPPGATRIRSEVRPDDAPGQGHRRGASAVRRIGQCPRWEAGLRAPEPSATDSRVLGIASTAQATRASSAHVVPPLGFDLLVLARRHAAVLRRNACRNPKCSQARSIHKGWTSSAKLMAARMSSRKKCFDRFRAGSSDSLGMAPSRAPADPAARRCGKRQFTRIGAWAPVAVSSPRARGRRPAGRRRGPSKCARSCRVACRGYTSRRHRA